MDQQQQQIQKGPGDFNTLNSGDLVSRSAEIRLI